MAIDEIRKIHILAYRDIEEQLIADLQEMGVVEVSEPFVEEGAATQDDASGSDSIQAMESALEHLDYTIDLLNRFSPAKSSFMGLGSQKFVLSARELSELAEGKDLEEAYLECRALEKELQEIKSERTRLSSEKHHLAPWQTLGSGFTSFEISPSISIVPGHVPVNRFLNLRESFLGQTDETALYEISRDARSVHIVLMFTREESAAVEEILKCCDFTIFSYPSIEAPPREAIITINTELDKLARREEHVRKSLTAIVPRRPRLLALRDYYSNLLDREKTRDLGSRTAESFSLTGWVPAEETKMVKESLQEKFKCVEVYCTRPLETDTVPVLLKNTPLVEPFEIITDLYGLPAYRGIDPTPYLSVFFATFFGFCLTDAGYGILLMLLTGFLLWKSRPSANDTLKKFYQLFFLGGAGSLLMGAFVGSWFGISVFWKVIDPLEDLMIFFGLALALGIIHIFTGLLIKMVRTIRSGNWAAGIYDQGLWMLIISALIGMGLVKAELLPASFYLPAKVISLGSALGILFFQGRRVDKNTRRLSGGLRAAYTILWIALTVSTTFFFLKLFFPLSGFAALAVMLIMLSLGIKNIGSMAARIGMGFYALYGISGYLGDTLSYSRLLALGLTTGIVAMIINKMAVISLGTPYIGWLMALSILIVGHIFNLVINILSAFVHSARLQYVEFFTKFYESGGRPFKPFRITNRYIMVKN